MNAEPQYIESIQKGSTVMYGNKPYRVQDDGKGYLHIIVFENFKRKKIAIKDVCIWFDYGSEPDWVFNGWYNFYTDYNLFRQYALSEKAWIKI